MPVASPSKHRMRVRYSEPMTRSGGIPPGRLHAPLGHPRSETGLTGGYGATNKRLTTGDSSDVSWDDAYAGEMIEVGEGNSEDSDAWTDEPTRAFEAVHKCVSPSPQARASCQRCTHPLFSAAVGQRARRIPP